MVEVAGVFTFIGLEAIGLILVFRGYGTFGSHDRKLLLLSTLVLPIAGPVLCRKTLKLKPRFLLQDFAGTTGEHKYPLQLAPVHPNLKLFHTTRHTAFRLRSNSDLSEVAQQHGLSLRPSWLERFDWILHYDLDWVLNTGPDFISKKHKHLLVLSKLRNPPKTIFIHNSRGLGIFMEDLLPKLKTRVIVYVGGGDQQTITEANPAELVDALLSDPKIVRVFTENKSVVDEKVIAMPIGLSVPEVIRCGSTLGEIQANIRIKEKKPKVLAGLWQELPQRQRATDFARANPALCDYHADKKPPEEYFWTLSKYRFVLSPPGKGMDCYRTYEALAVKSIPIVESCNKIYSEVFQGLPVVVIDDYAEITPEKLDDWWHALSPLLSDAPRFVQSDHWWEKIAAVKAEL